jgi:ribosomal protein S18 acetylase RimI-like enzyme
MILEIICYNRFMQMIVVRNPAQLDILSSKKASYGELNFGFSEKYLTWLKELLGNKHAYQVILMDGDNFVAYIASAETLWPNYLTVIEVFVSPEYQGKGVGKILLEHAKDFAKKEDLEGLMVQTENENIPAQKLYEKAGFSRIENKEWEGTTYKFEL